MGEFEALLEALKAFGLTGVVVAFIIMCLILAARASGLVVTGNTARIANVVLSAIVFGLSGDPNAETALHAALASVAAALMYELLKLLGRKANLTVFAPAKG